MSNYKFETLQTSRRTGTGRSGYGRESCADLRDHFLCIPQRADAQDRFGLADAGNIYGRLTNSTQDVFEKRIAALEGGHSGISRRVRRGGHHLYHRGARAKRVTTSFAKRPYTAGLITCSRTHSKRLVSK